MSDFERATAVRFLEKKGTQSIYEGVVPPDWNIGFVPLGGISLSIAMRAVMEVFKHIHKDPIIATANFLKPSRKGEPCRIEVEILKSGRQFSTATAILSQKVDQGEKWTAVIHLVTTWGDHSKEKGISIPMQGKLPPIETVEELKVDRIYPVDLPWARQGIGKYLKQRYPEDLPAGAVRKQWLRFTDHREPDLLSLTMFADSFTPTLLRLRQDHKEFESSYFPTMELSIHYRQKPKNGWLALITQSRTVVNGRFETDCDIYDEEGNLVAMSRQMGLIVSFERNAKYSDTEAPNPKL